MGSPEAARARALFLCALDGGRVPAHGRRPRQLGPSSGSGWVPAGLASSGAGWQLRFPRPGRGGWASGWRILSSQYGEGGREHRRGEWGLWLETQPERVRGALGLVAAPPARGSPWRCCGPCQESWWEEGPAAAAAGGGEGVRRGLGPPCPLGPQTRGPVSPWGDGGGTSLPFVSVSQASWGVAGPAPTWVLEVP